jgi:hypothetical protein
MKTRILFFFSFFAASTSFAQSEADSTKALFNNVHYSYMQWDLGYSGMNVRNQFVNGFDITLIGAVFNKHWFTGLGINGWITQTTPGSFTEMPMKVDSYVSVYLDNEYLVRPEKLINFSFPLKIGYTGASGYDTIPTSQPYIINWNYTGSDYYYYDCTFWTISPGANVFMNIFKPLSLGIGANYRFAFGVPKDGGKNADYSSYSINAFLRYKFDTKLYMKRVLERQKEYMQKAQ